MVVRTKAGPLPPSPSSSSLRKWALEAQLENCGEDTICLDGVVLETRDGLRSVGLNGEERPVLMPGDVRQVCFLVEEVDGGGTEEGGRIMFGVLSIGWRGTMGNRGFLSTGALGAKVT